MRTNAIGKITPHWCEVAASRILAGEPEARVLLDYGYMRVAPTPSGNHYEWTLAMDTPDGRFGTFPSKKRALQELRLINDGRPDDGMLTITRDRIPGKREDCPVCRYQRQVEEKKRHAH